MFTVTGGKLCLSQSVNIDKLGHYETRLASHLTSHTWHLVDNIIIQPSAILLTVSTYIIDTMNGVEWIDEQDVCDLILACASLVREIVK